MNNPLSLLVQAARSGGDPLKMLQGMAAQNPQAAQVMKMIHGKSPAELQRMAENIASNNGTTVQEVARRLGLM